MKIIQTFWTGQSATTPVADLLYMKYGWAAAEFHWMSWALSCSQLIKHHKEVELFTDECGKRILIDIFNLPYTNVHISHEDFKNHPQNLWAFSKIYTYSLQHQPFLHVDGDVYIWKAFDNRLMQAPLIAQNLEIDFPYYSSTLSDMMLHFEYIPKEISYFLEAGKENINAHNAGILGGNRTDVIAAYAREAFNLIKQNSNYLNLLPYADRLNFVAEQFLFTCFASQYNINVSTLLDDVKFDLNYASIANLSQVPLKTDYVHPVSNFKRKKATCNHLPKRLQKDHPELYKHVLKQLQSQKSSFYFNTWSSTAYQFALPKNLNKQLVIAALSTTTHPELVQDFEQFNYQIIEYQKSAPSIATWASYLTQQYACREQFCKYSPEEKLSTYLKQSPYCSLLTSQWPWTLRKRVNFEALLSINSRKPADEYWYILLPDEKNCEIAISKPSLFEFALLDAIAEGNLVKDIFNKIQHYFSKADVDENLLALQNLIMDTLAELIFKGVIIITNES